MNDMQKGKQIFKIINAEGLILGRMASLVAKRLLQGEEIIIVNAEKTVLSGKRRSKVRAAKEFLNVGDPRKGPFHYRSPHSAIRRTVRGMLPYKKPKGKEAYKRLKVFIGIPKDFKEKEMETLKEARSEKLTCPQLNLGELAKQIGWNSGK